MAQRSSLQARLMRAVVRRTLRGWAEGPIAQQRERQAASTRRMPMPKGVRVEPAPVGEVPAAWFTPTPVRPGALLYLHGGAYCLGSVASYRAFVAHLAQATRLRTLAIDYRLAPEHPFPAALEDAMAAYRWLLTQGYAPGTLVLAGDSAGGGLTVATLLALREAGLPLPAGAVAFSPWFDLTLGGESVRIRAAQDPMLDAEGLRRCARAYAGDTPLTHPLLSPLFADLRGLPPLLLQVGTAEILLDDTLRLAEAARAAGVAVTVQVWDELFHVFQLLTFLPESREALLRVAAFVEAVLEARASD